MKNYDAVYKRMEFLEKKIKELEVLGMYEDTIDYDIELRELKDFILYA